MPVIAEDDKQFDRIGAELSARTFLDVDGRTQTTRNPSAGNGCALVLGARAEDRWRANWKAIAKWWRNSALAKDAAIRHYREQAEAERADDLAAAQSIAAELMEQRQTALADAANLRRIVADRENQLAARSLEFIRLRAAVNKFVSAWEAEMNHDELEELWKDADDAFAAMKTAAGISNAPNANEPEPPEFNRQGDAEC